MRRWRKNISVICILCLLVVIFNAGKISKLLIAGYVRINSVELENFAISLIDNNTYDVTTTYDGMNVYYLSESNKVEFIVKAWGLVPSSRYEGFYYSPDDRPIGFNGVEVEFVKDASGWLWEEDGGDNWQRTERISGKWFWFMMNF